MTSSQRKMARREREENRRLCRENTARLGAWRRPKRNPYKIAERRKAWERGVVDRRSGFPIGSNAYIPRRRRDGFSDLRDELWSAWRRGWLEAGGYTAFLVRRRRRESNRLMKSWEKGVRS